ncbi:MAG: hypothetical protein ABR604_04290 [Jatrophihabitantaceae bacterium]
MTAVVIGVDPAKRSHAMAVLDEHAARLGVQDFRDPRVTADHRRNSGDRHTGRMVAIHLETRPVDAFGSSGVTATRLATVDEGAVTLLTYSSSGQLGRHPAAAWQLFVVTSGSGWVSGGDGRRTAVSAGDAVRWSPQEEHESGSDTGMTVTVVETHTRLDGDATAAT